MTEEHGPIGAQIKPLMSQGIFAKNIKAET